MPDARVVFHLPAKHLGDWRSTRHLRLFGRLAGVVEQAGGTVSVADRRERPFEGGEGAAAAYADGDLHILDSGRVQAPGVLNASMAYLPPYWHLDPAGIQAESSIAARPYRPAQVPLQPAMEFLAKLRKRWVEPRLSRRAQVTARIALPRGAIAVFLQGDFPQARGLTYMPPEAMLRAVAAGAGGRPVLVKPHPLAMEPDLALIGDMVKEGLPVVPTLANVHDILDACDVTVSYNSAVALEGFLHRKPAILFGRADFHHICETVTATDGFAATLDRVLAREGGGYAKFLLWYFHRNCLNVDGAAFPQRALAILAAAGFGADRLGLDLPQPDAPENPATDTGA
jgi:hypothetical protein